MKENGKQNIEEEEKRRKNAEKKRGNQKLVLELMLDYHSKDPHDASRLCRSFRGPKEHNTSHCNVGGIPSLQLVVESFKKVKRTQKNAEKREEKRVKQEKLTKKKRKKRKKWLNKTPAESGRRLRLHCSLIVIFIVKNGSFWKNESSKIEKKSEKNRKKAKKTKKKAE